MWAAARAQFEAWHCIRPRARTAIHPLYAESRTRVQGAPVPPHSCPSLDAAGPWRHRAAPAAGLATSSTMASSRATFALGTER